MVKLDKPARRTGRPRALPRGKVSSSREPFLRFTHPVSLRKKTLAVLEAVERSSEPTRHREELADVVVELTRCGMDAYFMKPLRSARVGFLTEQTASLGMTGAVSVVSSVIRNIIGGMGSPQLLSVCTSIRQFMK